MDAVEQIAAEVVRLAGQGGLNPLYVVALLVVLAVLLVGLRAAGKLDWSRKPGTELDADENGIRPPPVQPPRPPGQEPGGDATGGMG